MDMTSSYLEHIRSLVWGTPLLCFIGVVGLYLTVSLRGLQFTSLPLALKLAFLDREEKARKGDISNFQALMTSLAGAIGTGNIAGVATAITTGGVGALFWMWIIALLGMVIKYSESLLAIKFRERNAIGQMSGGPMYFLARGANLKFLGAAFAWFGIIATFGTGNMVQIHSVADAAHSLFAIDPWITGAIATAVTGIVLMGGVKGIAKVTEIFVPFMAMLYLIGGLFIVMSNIEAVPGAILQIINAAFNGQAAVGGFAGASMSVALQTGIARGIFSNEAGLGTSSIAAAAARSGHPCQQALVSMTGAFLSTIVVCTVTGLVILLSGMFGQADPHTGRLLNGAPLAMQAFGSQIWRGELVVTCSLIFFAYSTVLAWAYYGEKCVEFLFGLDRIKIYRALYLACIFVGAGLELDTVWSVADITNGLMVVPNLVGLLACRQTLLDETRDFLK